MSHHDYEVSRQVPLLDGVSFYGALMGVMRMADSDNLVLLQDGWPHVWDELQARYNAPGGWLDSDP
jgi:hypothetical protein